MADIHKSEAGRQAIKTPHCRALDRWPDPWEQRVAATRQGDTVVVATSTPAAVDVSPVVP